MTEQRFMSATRFFTEASLITAFCCFITYLGLLHSGPVSSLWWLLIAAPFWFLCAVTALMLSGYVMVDKKRMLRNLNAYPDQCPPENEVKLLTLGVDENGHKLRLLVDGHQKWVRVSLKDVEGMYQAQEVMKRSQARQELSPG